MRKLNLPWLIGLLIGIVVLAGLSYGVHEFQMSRNASAFIREAKRAQAENRPQVAVEHLRRYVKLAPRDNEGLIEYGMQLADLGKVLPAYMSLDEAIRRQPDRSDVRRRLVPLAMILKRYSDAIDHLRNYLIKEMPKDGELLVQLSDCQFARAEYKEAEQSLEAAIADSPQNLVAYLKLATLRRGKLDRKDAIDPINQMVANNSEDFHAYVNRVEWLIQRMSELKASTKVSRGTVEQEIGQLRKSAEADVQRALTLAPNQAETILLAAQIANEAGRSDEARQYCLSGIAAHPKVSRFYSILAELDAAIGDRKSAIDIARRGLAAQPKEVELKWVLANLLIDVENYADALDMIVQLRAAHYPEALVDYLGARLLVRRNDWVAAIKQLEAIRPVLRDVPELAKQVDVWLGSAYRETVSRDQQLISYRRAVALDPDWMPARLGLAESLVSANLLNEAVDEYQKIFSKPGAPVIAGLGLAKSLLLLNLRKSSSQKGWSEFDDVVKKIEDLGTAPSQIAILKMEKFLSQQQPEEAVKVIAAAREKSPHESELWVTEISLAQMNRDWGRVEQLLQDAKQALGDTVALRIVHGRYLANRQNAEAKNSLSELAVPDASWNEQQRLELATKFAPLFLFIGAFDEAIEKAAFVGRAQPNNLRIRLLLWDIALRAKRIDLMGQTLDEVRTITGEGPIWHYGEAVRMNLIGIEKNDPQMASDALAHLAKARSARPEWDKIPLLSAEILERQGELRAAGDQYLEAIRLGENSSAVASRALAILFREHRFEDADKLVRRLRESQSLFSDGMVRAEIDLSLQLGRRDEALNSVEQLVRNSRQSEDPAWLGKVFATLGKYEDAEEYFRQAVKANGKSSRPWVSLVQVLVLSKQMEKAEIVVEEAKAAIAPEEAMVALGQCYEILAKPDLARASYRAAVEQSPNDIKINHLWTDFLLRIGSTAEAEVALRKTIGESSGNDEISRNNRQWAQRRLASVLLARGGREQLTEASSLIDRNLTNESQKSAEDLRIKAMILARGSSRSQRRQATEILETLLAQESASPLANDDRFLLVGLYSATGERKKARAELRKLIAARKDDPRYVMALAQLSLQSEEASEAQLHLNTLQKLAPDAQSTADLNSQVLFAKGKYSEVFDWVKKIGDANAQESATHDSNTAMKLWAARHLEDFALRLKLSKKIDESARFSSEAERFYSKVADERPDERLSLAEFWGKTTKVDKALDMLKDIDARSNTSRFSAVAVAIMRNAATTGEQLERLQGLLKSDSSSKELPVALDLTSADLLAWRGDIGGANRLYRDVLRREGRNIAALNNLAFVISMTGGDQQEALRLVEQAIEIGGPMDALLDTRGLVHLAAGHPDKAKTDFDEAISERATAERRFHLSLAFAEIKDLKLARQSLDKADLLGVLEKDVHPLERVKLQKIRELLKDAGSVK